MKRVRMAWAAAAACTLVVFLAGCGARDGQAALAATPAPQGHYICVQRPDAGEEWIEELLFEPGQVTMVTGSVRQTVGFTLADANLTLETPYGDFAFPFAWQGADIVIDGILYALVE